MFDTIHRGHTWRRVRGGQIEVIMKSGFAQSVFVIVEICDGPGCRAGRTADGRVISDVSVGEQTIEGLQILTGKLRLHRKEGK